MPTVDLSEAEPRLARLVERALAGEEVVIARDGKPAVRLVPVEAEQADAKPARERVFGVLRGKGWAAPDAWEPMSEEELALWYDSPLFPEPKKKKSGARKREKAR